MLLVFMCGNRHGNKHISDSKVVKWFKMDKTSQCCSKGPHIVAVIGADCLIVGDKPKKD